MKLRHKSITYYINRMRSGQRFAVAGYSDAEWMCILGIRTGEKTGLGQVLDSSHGLLLADVLCRRDEDRQFMFAIPECLQTLPAFEDGQIDSFLRDNDLKSQWYERDMVTDSLAEIAGLAPFISQLRQMNVVVVGPQPLRGLDFLDYSHFVEICSPNLHMTSGGIDTAVNDALWYGQPAVYLVSAGVSAAVIIDRLYDKIPDSVFMDCGSIWDAFVGIGGQRQWRAELYAKPEKLEEWKARNLRGV